MNLSKLQDCPDSIIVQTEDRFETLSRVSSVWTGKSCSITTEASKAGMPVILSSSSEPIKRIKCRWQIPLKANLLFLGDAWERGYGDLHWSGLNPERIMPWYFMMNQDSRTHGIGVRTLPKSMCFWQIDSSGITLWIDVRCGTEGVRAMGKKLETAVVFVREGLADENSYESTQHFCSQLCPHPRLPKQPVYGGNNWYYTYGKSSAAQILDDTKNIVSLSPSGPNRPFMVIDSCWQEFIKISCCIGGPWEHGNSQFPDMAGLASSMKQIGSRPGLWYRPLQSLESIPDTWVLDKPGSWNARDGFILDPSVPAVLDKIKADISRFTAWGYELIKNDFTTFDLFGKWGFEMGADITSGRWSFRDRSKTSADIITSLYQAIAEAAGENLIIGCNTIGHLSAGIFHISRTGDDTSGREWERTRKMGINTLAFRMPQHGSFFAADADCVGLTSDIPWDLNKQWLDLLSKSGTPFFVSAAPDSLDDQKRSSLKKAFEIASVDLKPGIPLDWMESTCPSRWNLLGQIEEFDWYGTNGINYFFIDRKE